MPICSKQVPKYKEKQSQQGRDSCIVRSILSVDVFGMSNFSLSSKWHTNVKTFMNVSIKFSLTGQTLYGHRENVTLYYTKMWIIASKNYGLEY